MLFVAVVVFILILAVQLIVFGSDEFIKEDERLSFSDLSKPYKGATFWSVMSAIANSLIAFCFTINLFPLFSALKVKTNENCHHVTMISVFLIAGLYALLSIVCLFLFGTINNEGSDLMKIINKEK